MDQNTANLNLVFAAYLQFGTAVIVAAVTIVYVWMTNRISKASRDSADASLKSVEQMKDATRPILIPWASSPLISPRFPTGPKAPATMESEGFHLALFNIGPGAALNGRIKLEIGFEKDIRREPTLVSEDRTTVKPLGPTEHGTVYNYNSGDVVPIPSWSHLTIFYDDVYGRRFVTECQWNGTDWIGFKIYSTAHEFSYFNPDLPPKLDGGI